MPGQQRGRRSRAPVTVRSMSEPRPGWALQDAVRLAEQGYALDRVERLTGFAAAHVRSQLSPVACHEPPGAGRRAPSR